MLIIESVEVKWNKNNIKHYESLGYTFTKIGDSLEVLSNQLHRTAKVEVKVKCDYCFNAIKTVIYRDYYVQNQKGELYKDACLPCGKFKRDELNLLKYGVKNTAQLESTQLAMKKTNLERYGVENYSQTDEYKVKIKNTTIERYGVEHYSQTEEFKEKTTATMLERYGKEYYTQTDEYKERARNTNIERYGFPNSLQNEEIKQKGIATNLKRYGVENVFQSEEIKEKIRQHYMDNFGVEHLSQTDEFRCYMKDKWNEWRADGTKDNIMQKRIETSLERYGTEYPMQNPEISNKTFTTMYKNGTAPCSAQQKLIHELVGGELNMPVGRASLDISFPNEKVYLEYDGGGHDLSVTLGSISREDFVLKERRRGFYLAREGWKEIRIITKDDILPNSEIIVDFVEIAKSFLIADLGFSVRWNLNFNEVLVNYKHTYTIDEFLNKYKDKEAI